MRLFYNHNLPIFQMQLEISNAQRSEFEERSLELAQEVRDVQEERKIGEKKNGALAKEPEARMVETTNEEVKFIKAELISAREFRDH